MKTLQHLWRLVRVGGLALAAQAATSGAVHGNAKTATVAASVGAAETLYRLLVPTRDQSRVSTFLKAVRAVIAADEAKAKTAAAAAAAAVHAVEAEVPAAPVA